MSEIDALQPEWDAVMSACGKEASTYHHYLVGGDYAWLSAALLALCAKSEALGRVKALREVGCWKYVGGECVELAKRQPFPLTEEGFCIRCHLLSLAEAALR